MSAERYLPAAVLLGAGLIAGAVFLKPTEFETCVSDLTEQLKIVKPEVELKKVVAAATTTCAKGGR